MTIDIVLYLTDWPVPHALLYTSGRKSMPCTRRPLLCRFPRLY